MRILHVVETLHVGGLERVVIDLVKEQGGKGHNCQVVCLFEEGGLASELEAKGISVETCSKHSGLDLAAIKRLKVFIRNFSADIVHSHNVTCNYYSAAALLGNRNTLLVNTRHGIGKLPKKQKWMYGLSLLRTYSVAGVCDITTEMLRRQFPLFSKKIITVHNGIVLEAYKERNPNRHLSTTELLGVPACSMLVAIVARLNAVKNHSMLFRAFKQLLEAVPSAQLVVIGEGEMRTMLESEALQLGIEKDTVFLGDRRDVPFLLSGMDMFALSSTEEGYSISLLEACASALPIVATDVGGNAEIVHHGTNGYLVKSGDADSFAQQMVAILSDEEKMLEYGRNSRMWVEKEGSVQAMHRRYEDIYSRTSASSNHGTRALGGRGRG